MTIRDIIGLDNPILRKKALRVTSYDKKFQTLVDDMVETMLQAPGVGLAAPQIAVSRRVIVVRLQDDEKSKEEFGDEAGKLYIIANPEIIKTSKEIVEGVEGCLSIPGYLGLVDRHEQITIKGFDRYGKAMRVKASGWLARVFQHEIDHLDGQLYIDIARDIWQPKLEDETEEETESREA
jgi:peptide deformylase